MRSSVSVKILLVLSLVCVGIIIYEAVHHENDFVSAISMANGRPEKEKRTFSANSSASNDAPSSRVHTGGPDALRNNTEDTTAVIDNREKVFASRRELVRQCCQRHSRHTSFGRGMKSVPFQELRWLKKREMVVCFSSKVGTSTWMKYLLQDKFSPSKYQEWVEGRNYIHGLAEKYLKPEFPAQRKRVVAQLLNSTKVMNVRHPFVRLVSAFRDKIEPCLTHSVCHAKQHFKDWKSLLTFKGFAEYLVQGVPASAAANMKNFNLFDTHWRPYYLNCAVCDIDYDYIVKMETWDDDIRYILGKFGFEQEPNIHDNKKGSDVTALDYIRALPRPLILELYEHYSIDFEMFGYTVDEYLK